MLSIEAIYNALPCHFLIGEEVITAGFLLLIELRITLIDSRPE